RDHLSARSPEQGGQQRAVQDRPRQSRAGTRLHGPARIRQVLGGRHQPHRSGHPQHRQGRVTLRTDHIAGGAFVAFGLVVFALSADLPVGPLSFPGAGMMPKLVAALLVLFGALIVLRASESAPLASVPWADLPHAARVVAIAAVAIALYQTLGFVIT